MGFAILVGRASTEAQARGRCKGRRGLGQRRLGVGILGGRGVMGTAAEKFTAVGGRLL